MNRIKIMSPGDANGRLFRNDGPINPVCDPNSAQTMARAGQAITLRHEAAVRKVNELNQGHDWLDRALPQHLSRMVEHPVEVLRDAAIERSRASIAGQSLEKAKLLYNLVEIIPVTEAPLPAQTQNLPV